jgi:hypothetical protein
MPTNKYDAVLAIDYVSPIVTTLDAYDTTTTQEVEIRGFKTKTIVVVNSGATNGLTWSVLGSVDGGLNYDITVNSGGNIAASSIASFQDTGYYTHLAFQLKSQSSGSPTTAYIKFAALGV